MRCRDQRGSATVWGITWLALLLLLAQAGVLLAGLVARQHQVDAAADLTALSAAADVQRGGSGCVAAEEVAAANEVDLVECRIDGQDAAVEVVATVRLPLALVVQLRGIARAGP